MKICVTGGLGVNGAWTVRELLARGHDVVVIDNRSDTSLLPELPELDIAVCDVADGPAVRRVVAAARPACIIHMAAFVHANQHPAQAVHVNIEGTAAVCQAAAHADVPRVVYTSSKTVYGSIEDERGHPSFVPVRETDPPAPRHVYDITKMASEMLGRWHAAQFGFEFISLRFATIYGPGKLGRYGATAAYDSILGPAVAGENVDIPRGGDQRDDIVYIVDVARAVCAAALAPGPLEYDVFNIGSGRLISVADFAAEVARIIGTEIRVGGGLNPIDVGGSYYSLLDSARANRVLGWSPAFGPSSSIRHYVEAVHKYGLR